MKLAAYLVNGRRSYGIVSENGIIDLGAQLGQRYGDLKALLAANAVAEAMEYQHQLAELALNEVDFLPVIDNPGKIICVGMNYADKRLEFNEQNPAPTLFVRFADSQTGHRQAVLKPRYSTEFDYEGELAVIIGRAGENIAREQALEHVAGYSCYMDGSARDWQHSWYTAGKNGRCTGAFGPWMTTSDVIADPQNLTLITRLNGQQVQQDSTSNMIYSVAALIEYISTFTRLSAGDVIITGSPGGVGKKRTPPLFMHAGDRIEVDIEHIGCLANQVADAPLSVPETAAA